MELTVEKTGLLSGKKHLFTFTEYRGTLMFDREAPDRSAATLSVESASAMCRDAWLSAKDLRKVQEYAVKDMLAADRYPHITFRSTAMNKIDANRYQAHGTLTIRDIPKPVVLVVSLHANSDGSPVIEGASIVRLTDFGLKPPRRLLEPSARKMRFRSAFLSLLRSETKPQARGNKENVTEHYASDFHGNRYLEAQRCRKPCVVANRAPNPLARIPHGSGRVRDLHDFRVRLRRAARAPQFTAQSNAHE